MFTENIEPIVAGTALLIASACGSEGSALKSAESSHSSALSAPSKYTYFTCNATGWELNDRTRMTQVDLIDQVLEYDVTEPWMITSHDNCVFVTTDALNAWGPQQTYRGG